jgi:general stress protein 26
MERADSLKTVGEKMHGMRSCMFVTKSSDGFKARPMATQDVEFDGSVWFMTDKRSNKCKELHEDPTVGLEYAHSNGVRFVSVSGEATFSEDREKIKEFWNDFYKAWFEGPDDPNITLIEVKVKRAEYWDNKGGKAGALADMAIGAVTGNTNTLDEHEVVTF